MPLTFEARIDEWKAANYPSGLAGLATLEQSTLCCLAEDLHQVVLAGLAALQTSLFAENPCDGKLQKHTSKIFRLAFDTVNAIHCAQPCCLFVSLPFATTTVTFIQSFVQAWKICQFKQAFELYCVWRKYAEAAAAQCCK